MPGPIEWITTRGSLRGLARWLFLATIVIAPWFYGGTTAWSIEVIDGMLGVALALWIISLLLDRHWAAAPRSLLFIAALILIQGWWMVANARAVYDAGFHTFIPTLPIVPSLTGSRDYVVSFSWMLRATALIGSIFLVADMSRRRIWQVRLWYAVAIAAVLIAWLGLMQKATGAQMIFWQSADPWEVKTFFASYFYHSNAGAFLNLVLPPAAGLAVWKLMRGGWPWMRGIALAIVLLVVIAIVSNTSRVSQILGFVLVLTMAIALARPALRLAAQSEKRTLIIGAILLAITIASVAQAVRLDQPLRRWNELSGQLPTSARWTAYRLAVSNLTDSGWFGFGPGTFRAVFPHYQQVSGNQPPGTWRFLHDDYLQTILEWGWVGSLAIAALFFGGIAVGVRNYRKAEAWSTRQRILLACVLLALGGVALHAAVDFPLQIYSIQLLVATYLGICWGSGTWGEGRKEELRTRDQAFLRRSF